MRQTKPFFNRAETELIKGVALILMMAHHFFTFPEWWIGGISYPGLAAAAQYLNDPLKICVPVFCFLTGYFYGFNPDRSYRYSFRKITDILLTYWIVFIPFAVIAAVFADYSYTAAGFVRELFAVSLPTMTFCWYVRFYIVAMLLLPLCSKILDRSLPLAMLFAFVVTPFCFRLLNTAAENGELKGIFMELATFIPVLMSGYLFAVQSWFEKLFDSDRGNRWPKPVKIVFWIALAAAAAMLRWAVPSVSLSIDELPKLHIKPVVYTNLDIIYAPVFIGCIVKLHRYIHTAVTGRILGSIGRHSLLMWFASCIFFNNSREIFQPLLYLPRNPLLVMIWGTVLCWGAAALLKQRADRLLEFKNRLLFEKPRSQGEGEEI